MTVSPHVAEIVAGALEGQGVAIYDVEQVGGSLRVLVSGPGVDLDRLAELTRVVSSALDAADPIDGRYLLEVSTPGLERVLRTPNHFAAAIGEQVSVKTTPDHPAGRRLAGVLAAATDDEITLRPVDGDDLTIAIADVERARTVFEWGPPPRPPKPKKGTAKQPAKAKPAPRR